MQGIPSRMRKQVCTTALSLALLPLTAMAQSQSTYPATQDNTSQASSQRANPTTQNNAAQSGYTSGQSSTSQTHSGQQAMGASGTAGATASGAKQAGSGKSATAVVPVATFVLIPTTSPLQDQWMRTGCWAKLHDNPGFSGDTLTLSRPIDMPDMVSPFGISCKNKISSIETGANTTLTVYDNANYRDPVSTFKPGERVADVSKRMGFFDDMRSLRITCTGAGSAPTR